MKKYSYVLIDKDPGGPTEQSGDNPIAVFHGDSKDEAVRNIIRIIAKYLAKGDITRILEKEVLIAEDEDAITEIIQNEEGGSINVNGHCISIQPISLVNHAKDTPSEGIREDDRYVVQDIVVNERTGKDLTRIKVRVQDSKNTSYEIDLVTADAYDSPFIYHSPFQLKEGEAFAVDEETGQETGPYTKIEDLGYYFIVHTKGKAGALLFDGSVVLDCIYDGIYPQLRHYLLVKDGKVGLLYGRTVIPCEYDDIDFPDSEGAPEYIHAWKRGEKGLLATDGSFHPLTGDDPDSKFDYLLA